MSDQRRESDEPGAIEPGAIKPGAINPGAGAPAETPGGRRFETVLPRFSLRRRVTVLVLLATTLVVGAVATLGIPIELFPSGFEAPFLGVDVPWRDAPAQEVLDKIVRPIEEELSTVKGIDRLFTTARVGGANAFLMFKQGTDMDVAYREVRDRIERARVRMPDDADRIFISKHDPASIPTAFVGLALDPDLADPYDLIQKQIVLPLSRLDGVANVEAGGLEEKEIIIELDRERTEAAGLNIYQLAQELGGDNFSLASGTVYSGEKKLLLRSLARFESLEALEGYLVAPSVRLSDVASVEYKEPEKKYRLRVNGKPAIGVQVYKEGDANTLEVSRAIAGEVERMQGDPRLKLVEMDVLFDQGEVIMESLDALFDSGRIGGLFALGVLFFFLRRFRMTLIITLSIPLSLLIALTVMYFAGESLNLLSLLGLMICVGLLVDNSVVVAENIYRLHSEGMAPRQAAIRGAGEIALAITMATLTTVVVFLPASLVEGMGQFFLLRLSIPISVSLLASLIVALVFVPLSVYLTLLRTDTAAEGASAGAGKARGGASAWLARTVGRPIDRALSGLYKVTLEPLNDLYNRLLARALAPGQWLHVVVGCLLVIVLTFSVAQGRIAAVGQDEDERGALRLDIELPQSNTLEETAAYFDRLEAMLQENQEKLGLEGFFFFHQETFGELQAWIANPLPKGMTPSKVREELRALLPETPGMRVYGSGQRDEDDGPKTQRVTLIGEDAEQLDQLAEELEPAFGSIPGVVGLAESDRQRPVSQLALVIDRDRAQRQGISPSVIAGVVGYALRGQQLPKYYAEGREIPVRVRFEEEDREGLAELASFEVPVGDAGMNGGGMNGGGMNGGGGHSVSLSSLTDVRFLPSARAIQRQDKQIARSLDLELVEGEEKETRERILAMTRQIDLPEGVRFASNSGLEGGIPEDVKQLMLAALLSVVFIYLLMSFLFESFMLPLSILLTIPLASIGVMWSHILADKDIDSLGMIGMVLLVGVVVNNGIVLIDYVNRLREDGLERTAAILQAAHHRFRPIMMTAMTTICGMIPLTFGGANSVGLSYKSFGYTLIGGLTTATVLTLLVVPVFYALFDDMREAAVARVMAVWRGRKRRRSETEEPAADAVG